MVQSPENKASVHHIPEQKSSFFTLLTSSSEIIGIFIAVGIIVAGSLIVFGNNAKKETKREVAKKTQKQQREKITTKNITNQLSVNTKRIKSIVAKSNKSLQAANQTSTRQNSSSVAVGPLTPESLNLQADRQIAELWQAQNATYANRDLSEGLQNQIAQKITGKIRKIDSIQKRIPTNGTPSQLGNAQKQIQDQNVYSCYLPNLTKQNVNENYASLAREQGSVTKDLRDVNTNLKKQGKKTTQLSSLINARNKKVRDITTNIQQTRQNGIQAEDTNCVTPSQVPSIPLGNQFTDLANLDEQIRQLVDQLLKEKGVESAPSGVLPTSAKNSQKKLAREIKRSTKQKPEKGTKKNGKPTPIDTPKDTSTDEPTPTASEGLGDATPTEEPVSPEPTGEEKGSSTPLEKPDFASMGLPQPQAGEVSDLKASLEGNEDAKWAATALLKGEKTVLDKGMKIIPYLTTAWIWFESGGMQEDNTWPDPYAINCNDNRTGYVSEVSVICQSSNYQIAGYQAAAQSGQYVSLFTKFYDPGELAKVVQRVASDSQHAIRPQWNYNDPGQLKGVNKQYITQLSSVKIGDISPNVDFFSEKGQYFTLLVGKDPTMVIALNSFAVSDDDLVGALKSTSCSYGYICAGEKQRLSNLVASLYQFDGGTL